MRVGFPTPFARSRHADVFFVIFLNSLQRGLHQSMPRMTYAPILRVLMSSVGLETRGIANDRFTTPSPPSDRHLHDDASDERDSNSSRPAAIKPGDQPILDLLKGNAVAYIGLKHCRSDPDSFWIGERSAIGVSWALRPFPPNGKLSGRRSRCEIRHSRPYREDHESPRSADRQTLRIPEVRSAPPDPPFAAAGAGSFGIHGRNPNPPDAPLS